MGPDDIEDEDDEASLQAGDESNVDEAEPTVDQKAVKGETVRESIARALKAAEAEDDPETKETPVKEETEPKEPKDKEIKPKVVDTKPKITTSGPPPGWTKEAKAEWDKLPQTIKDSVAKRELEASNGFKTYGEKVKEFEEKQKENVELEAAFAPHAEVMKSSGRTKAQVINQMFGWMNALNQPNKEEAKKALLTLASNYGITFEAAAQPKPEVKTPKLDANGVAIPEPEIPEALKLFIDGTTGKLKTLEEQLAQQNRLTEDAKRAASTQRLAVWSKDKPHFEAVRKEMHVILANNLVPLKDGELDLDSAYDRAVYANPVTRELKQKEDAEKVAAEAETKRKEKELANLKKLNASKKAGSSISARAPTGAAVTSGQANKNGKPESVRQTMLRTVQELRDN